MIRCSINLLYLLQTAPQQRGDRPTLISGANILQELQRLRVSPNANGSYHGLPLASAGEPSVNKDLNGSVFYRSPPLFNLWQFHDSSWWERPITLVYASLWTNLSSTGELKYLPSAVALRDQQSVVPDKISISAQRLSQCCERRNSHASEADAGLYMNARVN